MRIGDRIAIMQNGEVVQVGHRMKFSIIRRMIMSVPSSVG